MEDQKDFIEEGQVEMSVFTTMGCTNLLCFLQVICRWGGDLFADDNVVPINPVIDNVVDFSQGGTTITRK